MGGGERRHHAKAKRASPERAVRKALSAERRRDADERARAKREQTARFIAELLLRGLPPEREAELVRQVLQQRDLTRAVKRYMGREAFAALRVRQRLVDVDEPSAVSNAAPTPVPAAPSKSAALVRVDPAIPQGELATVRLASMAVPAWHGAGVDATLLAVLTDVALAEAGRKDGLSVVGDSDIEAMLSFEKAQELVGCDDATCAVQIGGALGVDAVLSGKIGQVGETYVLTLTVLDIGSSRPLVRGEARATGAADELIDLVAELVRQTLAALPSTPA
jgi:hypothetical protein